MIINDNDDDVTNNDNDDVTNDNNPSSSPSSAHVDNDSGALSHLLHRAKSLMAPFVLRRLKADVLTQLPPKSTHVAICPLDTHQSRVYSAQRTLAANQNDALGGIMMLRRAANHPLLVRGGGRYSKDDINRIARVVARRQEYRKWELSEVEEMLQGLSDFEIGQECEQSEVRGRRGKSDRGIWEDIGLLWLI